MDAWRCESAGRDSLAASPHSLLAQPDSGQVFINRVQKIFIVVFCNSFCPHKLSGQKCAIELPGRLDHNYYQRNDARNDMRASMESPVGLVDSLNIALPLALVAFFIILPVIQSLFSRKRSQAAYVVTETQKWRLRVISPVVALIFVSLDAIGYHAICDRVLILPGH